MFIVRFPSLTRRRSIKFPAVGQGSNPLGFPPKLSLGSPILKTVVRYVLNIQPKTLIVLPKRQALGTLSFAVPNNILVNSTTRFRDSRSQELAVLPRVEGEWLRKAKLSGWLPQVSGTWRPEMQLDLALEKMCMSASSYWTWSWVHLTYCRTLNEM